MHKDTFFYKTLARILHKTAQKIIYIIDKQIVTKYKFIFFSTHIASVQKTVVFAINFAQQTHKH